MSLGEGIVQWYLDRIGQGEVPAGSNRGPIPDECYRYVHDGADPAKDPVADRQWSAQAYCTAAHAAGVPAGPKTAGTGALYDYLASRELVIWVPRPLRQGRIKAYGSPRKALPGDGGLIIDDTTHTGFRHTTCLVERLSAEIWRCVAGNEGDRVDYTDRHISEMVIVRAYKEL